MNESVRQMKTTNKTAGIVRQFLWQLMKMIFEVRTSSQESSPKRSHFRGRGIGHCHKSFACACPCAVVLPQHNLAEAAGECVLAEAAGRVNWQYKGRSGKVKSEIAAVSVHFRGVLRGAE